MASVSALEFSAETARPASSRQGALGEFLLVGGATWLFLPIGYLLRAGLGFDDAELVVGFTLFHAAHVINDPHFAVTYLLFYRNLRERAFGASLSRAQRLRYVFAGLVVPLALGGFIALSLARHSAHKLGLVLQAMFVLVGWHYVKQSFGVLSVLSARRGVRFSLGERRVVLAHCISAWLFARFNPRDAGREASSDGVVYATLAHPAGLDVLTSVAFALSTLLLVALLVRRHRRDGRLPPLLPLVAFLTSVWLWTAFSRLDPLLVYAIPALHSIQYLYFVWLLRRNQARSSSGPPAFASVGRSLFGLAVSALALGWLILRGLPGWLDGMLVLHDPFDLLGETPYFAAFGAFVNIHHYFMDAVIWRSENPDTRHLLA